MVFKLLNQQFIRIYWFYKYQVARLQSKNKSLKVLNNSSHIKNILVMCYGNIYRSPLVSSYLKSHLTDDYVIESAGFYPKSGRKSADDYIELVKEFGIDLSNHHSTCVDKNMLDWADHIIIMDGKNYKLSMLLNNNIESKLIWLGAISSNGIKEIEDPYSKSIDEQLIIVKQLISSCDDYISLIK